MLLQIALGWLDATVHLRRSNGHVKKVTQHPENVGQYERANKWGDLYAIVRLRRPRD